MDLTALTFAQLKALASQNKIKDWNTLPKEKLIAALSGKDLQPVRA